MSIIGPAIEEALQQITFNAGWEPAVVVEKIRDAKGGEGFNALTGKFDDLYAAGIIDPTKVTRGPASGPKGFCLRWRPRMLQQAPHDRETHPHSRDR